MKDKPANLPLAKPSLHELLACKLKQMILNKTWTGCLPGIRTLGKSFGVSTLVVNQALQVLEDEGLLEPAEKGVSRRISRKALKAIKDEATLIFLRPYRREMTDLTLDVYDLCMKQLRAMKIKFRDIPVHVSDSGEISMPNHEDLSQITRISGVVACDVAHDKVRDLLAPNTPMLVMGPRYLEDDYCASISFFLPDTICTILDQAFTLGRKHVALFTCYPCKGTHENLRAYIQPIYQKHKIRFNEDIHLPYCTMSNIEPVISRILDYGVPDAIICMGNDQWSYLSNCLMQRGISTEVLALFDHPLFRLFKKPPTICKLNYEDYGDAMLQWHRQITKGKNPSFSRKVGVRFTWEKEG